MPKNKPPVPRKSGPSPEDKEDALTQKLCDLAIDLAEQEDSETMSAALQQTENDFRKLVKKCLYQKKDEVLYAAIERAKYADSGAHLLLKACVEETAETIVVEHERDGGPAQEVNAFVIPIFVRTAGGLDSGQSFQDQPAFEALTKSFQEAQLESPDAKVVLISHAYHLDEIDSITYSHLNEMVRDALASMTDKKSAPTPAIDRSLGGWPENVFAPQDQAVELRFLLGFALKTTDDAFYQVPQDEDAADAYFALREERFQRWTEQVAPLVQRCLVTDGREVDVNFLYQDLFHGGKERGIAEYFMLQMMSELNHGMQQHGVAPEQANAMIGPADVRDEMLLRVNLYADGALIATSEKPFVFGRDLQVEIDDTYDALTTIGVTALAVAHKFDADGQPVDARPYQG
jgi:hypothetical protein